MLSKFASSGEDQAFYSADTDDIDDEPGKEASAHRCSMVKRYLMPTFFSTPDKQLSSKLHHTPSPSAKLLPSN
jgi:hypothetical protein